MPSYVFVWENNTMGHRAVEGLMWPGHSSLQVGNDFSLQANYVNDHNPDFVSWWPQVGGEFDLKGVIKTLFQKRKTGATNAHFFVDCAYEGYLPDHVIKLNTSERQENRMSGAWREIYNKYDGVGASYGSLSKNCSTIVSRVLHAAGICSHKWSENHHAYWTPADIRKLACGAGGTLMTWENFNTDQRMTTRQDISNGLVAQYTINGRLYDFDVTTARSGQLCSTGAPCRHQAGETFPR